ncbi:hypothetical protein [[Acholeplasma] multilocale]|uniref:hypothetical protein n=1 Tax=[Acholeplasma] multilocale TaxID=264638 RepID=UPI00047EBBA2|nr:hypothetical protein [[Acholeplasma] multilocale]
MKKRNKNTNSESKNNKWWTSVKEWFSTLGKTTQVEFESRVFMSWKRIIKFVGIALVPIIYGVVCVLAFWNPIAGIGKAPIAIMNNDHAIIMVTKNEPAKDDLIGDKLKLGVLESVNGKTFSYDGKTVRDLEEEIFDLEKSANTLVLNNGITIDDASGVKYKAMGAWDILKQKLLPKTDETISDQDYTFSSPMIKNKIQLDNIRYIDNSQTIDKEWQATKYYAQMRIEENYMANLIGYAGSILYNDDSIKSPSDWVNTLNGNQIKMWTTFERNFMFGYLMDTFTSFVDGIIIKSIPSVFTSVISGTIMGDLSTSGAVLNKAITPNGETTSNYFEKNEDYVLLSTNINAADNNPDDLAKYTLFGNVNIKNGELVGRGGKIINMLSNIKANGKNLLANAKLFEMIDTITGNKTISTIIKGAIEFVLDEAFNEVQLNQTLFNAAVGNPQQDQGIIKNIIDQIIKFIEDKTNINISNNKLTEALNRLLVNMNVFDAKQPKLTEKEFSVKIDEVIVKNPDLFLGITSASQLPGAIIDLIHFSITGGIGKDDIMTIEIQGEEFGLYGIGLGIFFLVIGLWIGVLMHTFVYDRGKRLQKASGRQWYLSKTIMMMTTVVVQATLEILAVTIAGWHILGFATMFYIWLWFIASGLMFVVIIQSLWFVVKDETVGKFLVIIMMVLSLAAGGGTFPAFAQLPFFHYVGYVVPFTYVIKGFTAIVYGTSLGVPATAATNAFILQNFAVFFIYIAIFLTLGLTIGQRNRLRDMNYGGHMGRKVASAMKALGRDTSEFEIIKSKEGKKDKIFYNWKALPNAFDQELYMKTRAMYPFEGSFKWYDKKEYEFVQKPNYSDEDQISRNE